MRTANPALRQRSFSDFGPISEPGKTMTVNGTATKALLLATLVLLTGYFTWNQAYQSIDGSAAMPWMIGGIIGGLIVALIIIFKQTTAPFLAPIYALLEGLFLGGISAFMETMYPGIVIQAVLGTFGVLFFMLFLYRTGLIQVDRKFILGVAAATGAVFFLYLASWVLSFFGTGIPFIFESGPIGIGVSLVIIGIAALNLVIDFHIIAEGSKQNAPKFMEWYGAFALMVTLIWLYMEILRFISLLRQR
jgi:uncharacterized YccA/Bax inhibitor family protein